MRKRVGCILVVFALTLTGCSPLLQRQTLSVEPHVEQYVEDAFVLRAENYQELVNAILYLVSEAAGQGVIRLYDYQGEVSKDVPAACLEVTKDDPLGAYAVDYMTNEYAHIMAYYEVTINIGYRRTAEQIRAVVSATGSSAIRQEIKGTLGKFGSDMALRIGYFTEEGSYIEQLVHSAYYDTPQAAFGMPGISVSIYPESGTQRVVEIELTYGRAAEDLLRMKEQTSEEAWKIVEIMSARTEENKAHALYDALVANVQHDTETEKAAADPGFVKNNACTALGALVEGKAVSEGYALAYKLLCDDAEIECMVVQGTVKSVEHFWNIVRLGGVYYHVDVALGDVQSSKWFLLRSDADFEKSYDWDRDQYPLCSGRMELVPGE